eukprot:TRINITY_DN7145_c0_g2_i1.p1 TRINITY_DN7145_c0_g2~~TRINITY_DN7145_c0_g2_i1.p1  ORF type:complete len:222 (+),score=45.46 TRINITY_DN7145_c0_g2_i1:92-757(+)
MGSSASSEEGAHDAPEIGVLADADLATPPALAEEEVAAFLDLYCFTAVDAWTWPTSAQPSDGTDIGVVVISTSPAEEVEGQEEVRSQPTITLAVTGHTEENGHTLYVVKCSMELHHLGKLWYRLNWEVGRRLCELRTALQEPTRQALGPGRYDRIFARAPFALRAGPRGTTARLNTWFDTFATAVNTGDVPPIVVAAALQFLDAPEPMCGEGDQPDVEDET